MNQDVTDYIGKLSQSWQADAANHIRQIIHQAIPDVQERIQYGKPHFLKNGKYALVLGTAKEWVNLTIFNAAELSAPDGLFEPGGSPERKSIKIRQGQEPDDTLLASLIQQAAAGL